MRCLTLPLKVTDQQRFTLSISSSPESPLSPRRVVLLTHHMGRGRGELSRRGRLDKMYDPKSSSVVNFLPKAMILVQTFDTRSPVHGIVRV